MLGVHTRIWIPAIKMEFVIVLGWDYDRAAFDLQIFPGLGTDCVDKDNRAQPATC